MKSNEKLSLLYRVLVVLILPGFILYGWFVVDLITNPNAPGSWDGTARFRWLCVFLYAPANVAVGFLIMRRVRGNVVGPAMVLWGIQSAAWSVQMRIDTPEKYVQTAASMYSLSVGLSSGLLLFLCFPDGKAFPARFGRLYQILFLVWALNGVVIHLAYPVVEVEPVVSISGENLLFVPVLAPLQNISRLLENLWFVGWFIVPIILILRYIALPRGSRERKQLQWLALGLAIIIPFFIPILLSNFQRENRPVWLLLLAATLYSYANMLPAIAVGNAILRHRLYDIDIIIRRTLIYSILSAILAVVFFGGVTVTQAILRSATGQSSDVAVVISTLGIAALFTPLRRRVQAVIDRRFYRTKYDAQKTLEQFSAVMRDEVDAEKLKAALVATIQETMQPKHIALWIKDNITETTK